MNSETPKSILYVDDVMERMDSTERRITLAATFVCDHIAARYRRGTPRVAIRNEVYIAILAIAAGAAETAAAEAAGYKTFAELEAWQNSREAMYEEEAEAEEELDAQAEQAALECHDVS